MTLEEDIVAALTAATEDSWSWLEMSEPLVLTKRSEPGIAFVANVVIIKQGTTRETGEGVLLASQRKEVGLVREHDVRIGVERGVTITQESFRLTRGAATVGVTSSAAGSDVQPTADLMALLLRGLSKETV